MNLINCRWIVWLVVVAGMLALAAGVGCGKKPAPDADESEPVANAPKPTPEPVVNAEWKADLTNAKFPTHKVRAEINGGSFPIAEVVIWKNLMAFREHKGGKTGRVIELGLTGFSSRSPFPMAEDHSIKKLRPGQKHGESDIWIGVEFNTPGTSNWVGDDTKGFVLMMELGEPTKDGAMPGKILACFDSRAKGYFGGTFELRPDLTSDELSILEYLATIHAHKNFGGKEFKQFKMAETSLNPNGDGAGSYFKTQVAFADGSTKTVQYNFKKSAEGWHIVNVE